MSLPSGLGVFNRVVLTHLPVDGGHQLRNRESRIRLETAIHESKRFSILAAVAKLSVQNTFLFVCNTYGYREKSRHRRFGVYNFLRRVADVLIAQVVPTPAIRRHPRVAAYFMLLQVLLNIIVQCGLGRRHCHYMIMVPRLRLILFLIIRNIIIWVTSTTTIGRVAILLTTTTTLSTLPTRTARLPKNSYSDLHQPAPRFRKFALVRNGPSSVDYCLNHFVLGARGRSEFRLTSRIPGAQCDLNSVVWAYLPKRYFPHHSFLDPL